MDIALENVKVRVGPAQRHLFGIDQLKIAKGDKVLIKGASGRGKTTFLHLLAGLFLPDEGRIRVGGSNINELDDKERSEFRRRNIGIVFQKLNLIDYMTALENTELGLGDHFDEAQAIASLRSVGLDGRERDRAGVLSLGEQQRVAIARVLISPGKIVLADEPTSSLDEKNAFEVMELLFAACREKTLIVVSHDHRVEKYFSTIKDFEDFAR